MNALLLVDLQQDFLPGGALAVPRGDEVVPVANVLMPRFEHVVATQDWHPPDHVSFASQHPGKQPGEFIELNGKPQILWPDHCVQGTEGAELAAGLDVQRIDHVVRKGTDRRVDSYSGFFDNDHLTATGLEQKLRERGVSQLYIVGLATDYCVKFTVLDARQLGFSTTVIADGVRGVELQTGDVAKALDEMRSAGARIVTTQELSPGRLP
jgi:nicotinamidase/pyrazinamidase